MSIPQHQHQHQHWQRHRHQHHLHKRIVLTVDGHKNGDGGGVHCRWPPSRRRCRPARRARPASAPATRKLLAKTTWICHLDFIRHTGHNIPVRWPSSMRLHLVKLGADCNFNLFSFTTSFAQRREKLQKRSDGTKDIGEEILQLCRFPNLNVNISEKNSGEKYSVAFSAVLQCFTPLALLSTDPPSLNLFQSNPVIVIGTINVVKRKSCKVPQCAFVLLSTSRLFCSDRWIKKALDK